MSGQYSDSPQDVPSQVPSPPPEDEVTPSGGYSVPAYGTAPAGPQVDHPPGTLPDPVVLRMAMVTKLVIVVAGILLALLGGSVVVSATVGVFVQGEVVVGIIGVLVGGMFTLLGLYFLRGIILGWSTFLAIGSQGINWHVHEDRWIGWDEISEVGISLISSAKGGSVVRIRIAGTVPGLPHRPDLDRWRTRDEPEPYTHKILPPRPILASNPNVNRSAEALQQYAGPRYTGIAERTTAVRRYN